MIDKSGAAESFGGSMSGGASLDEPLAFAGNFHFRCTDSEGRLLWEETDHNLVTTLGKNALLDNTYGTPASLVGPYMGLISSASFSAVAAADTMSSHAGWLEANATNAPDYSGNRQTVVYGAASGGVKTATGLSFVFTNSGTVQGAFIVAGSGAITTKTSTAGVLHNAGTLSAAQPVISGNTLTITHSGTIS